MAHIDFKVTSWERIRIPEDKVADAIEKIKDGTISNAGEAMVGLGIDTGPEPVDDTCEQMSLSENEGNATIEVYEGNRVDAVYDNTPDEHMATLNVTSEKVDAAIEALDDFPLTEMQQHLVNYLRANAEDIKDALAE